MTLPAAGNAEAIVTVVRDDPEKLAIDLGPHNPEVGTAVAEGGATAVREAKLDHGRVDGVAVVPPARMPKCVDWGQGGIGGLFDRRSGF